jgi:Zn-dependent metalloprotease
MTTRKTMAKKSTAPSRKRRPDGGNGLKAFSMHAASESGAKMISAVGAEIDAQPQLGFASSPTVAELDPETAAQRYLQQTLASNSVRSFTVPKSVADETDFKSLGAETIPLTGTVTVKFRQRFNKVPIYGSLVTVELGKDNSLVSMNSAIGEPTGVNAVAKVSPADAIAAVKSYGDFKKNLDNNAVPRIYFYYDQGGQKWRLVYVLEDIPVTPPKGKGQVISPRLMDYIVDAQTGKVISELPRSAHMAAMTDTALDGLGVSRTITVESNGAKRLLRNVALNVQTFDFSFNDPELQTSLLPGKAVANPPKWTPTAVSAHANATAVAEFLRTVLGRNNIDNNGGPMNSSINCVVVSDSEGPKVWRNAFWDGQQMVYGQVQFNGGLLSICVDLDVVAHEMFHGVTDNTSRLEYQTQSGALNESYSDIFGVIVANSSNPDASSWNWKLGQRLDTNGRPFRDMSNPTSLGQPDHMRDFKKLPVTRKGDYGGVHTNSGIHNFAAYKILIAKDTSGNPVLTPAETAQIFYLADTQRLSATSQFSDSRRAVADSALSLFRNLPLAQKKLKLAAIDDAFDAVGIPGTRVKVS